MSAVETLRRVKTHQGFDLDLNSLVRLKIGVQNLRIWAKSLDKLQDIIWAKSLGKLQLRIWAKSLDTKHIIFPELAPQHWRFYLEI